MIKIKICGLTREEDIMAVNGCLPDYVGFVFAPSRRRVTLEQARSLKKNLDKRIKTVGVFVDSAIEDIIEMCEAEIIDVIQLHGDEGAEFLTDLKQKVTCPVIKAVRVQSQEQVMQAQQLPCDMLLLDTYQDGQYGGSGETFDHRLIPCLHKPFLLAGGLNRDNIRQAIEDCHPWGVDTSSGVETDGLKDEAKIREFIDMVRKSEQKG